MRSDLNDTVAVTVGDTTGFTLKDVTMACERALLRSGYLWHAKFEPCVQRMEGLGLLTRFKFDLNPLQSPDPRCRGTTW